MAGCPVLLDAPTIFDPALLSRTDQRWLAKTSARIRVCIKHLAQDVIAVGQLLLQARRRLGRGQFIGWVSAELGLHHRTAWRVMAVAKVFGKAQPHILARIDRTALYTLAQPSVPQSIREYALERAADGEHVTKQYALELLHDRISQKPAPLKLASKDPPKTVDPDAVFSADNWGLLRGLVERGGMLHISATRDAEIGDLSVTMIWTPEMGGPRRVVTRSTLENVLLDITGEARDKACRKCKKSLPLSSFSRRQDAADGRNNYCLECERKRVSEWTRLGGKTQTRKRVEPS